MFDQLRAPFPPEAISWRAQTLTSDGTKAMALAYIDARDVMRRFDEACGPANWQDHYVETAKGRVIGTIEVRTEEGWVAKSDGAGDTDVEGDKGGLSDAFKRTAVKWGVGRYLYDVEVVWAPCETYERSGKKHWKAWKPEAARLFAAALLKASAATHGAPPAEMSEPERISYDDVTRIEVLLEGNSIPVAELLKAAKVERVTDILAERTPAVMAWIERRIKANTTEKAA